MARSHKIVEVIKGSIAEEVGLEKDDILLAINGTEIIDVIDYIEWMESEELELLIRKADGEEWEIEIEKEAGEDLGLKFEHDLMDEQRNCRNKCVFCFVDQLPKGMRDSLYYKDDDWRLSFLVGNYITLTNLSDCDVDRIVEKQISPLYISVHTTNPQLRKKMLNNRFAGDVLKYLYRMAEAGIKVHTQIVLCPGWNDGEELDRTIEDLWQLRHSVQSLAVVPVGLTGHRQDLSYVAPFKADEAARVIEQVEKWQERCRAQGGGGFVYAADEFYILADRKFPPAEYYDEFPQLENGVGMTVEFLKEFDEAIEDYIEESNVIGVNMAEPVKRTVITGRSAFGIISGMVQKVNEQFGSQISVIPVENRFFGTSVTVAGLVTGSDIVMTLKNTSRDLGDMLLIPDTMLRKGQDVFLDDMTVPQLTEETGMVVVPVSVRGYEFLNSLLGTPEEIMKNTKA
jgi:putative radical SAM enzyme (TIGR03279 family)